MKQLTKQAGGKITDTLKARYAQSPHWDGKKFLNLEEITMDINIYNLPKLLYKQFFDTDGRTPEDNLPVKPFDKSALLTPSEKARFIWYGHSALIMRMKGQTMLIDPMLGPDASPIAPFSTSRFSTGTLELIDAFPEIDLMLLTHDHYDHLDLASLEKLIPKVKHYFVALGTARHLIQWGVEPQRITEFDWWDNQDFNGIHVTFTPTRHFSGRGLTDRAKSLWGGWAFRTDEERIYVSGDGGYGQHFQEVGRRLGPFDVGLMECGQYNENWHQIHMYPEEAVQAAMDVGARQIMPVHWGGFSLALHSWKDPVERFVAEADNQQIAYLTPELGSMFSHGEARQNHWWAGFK